MFPKPWCIEFIVEAEADLGGPSFDSPIELNITGDIESEVVAAALRAEEYMRNEVKGLKNIFSKSDYLKCEYNWADHRVYKHKYSINDYYSHDQPLGFWAGPHAEEFILSYGVKFKEIKFESKLFVSSSVRQNF